MADPNIKDSSYRGSNIPSLQINALFLNGLNVQFDEILSCKVNFNPYPSQIVISESARLTIAQYYNFIVAKARQFPASTFMSLK